MKRKSFIVSILIVVLMSVCLSLQEDYEEVTAEQDGETEVEHLSDEWEKENSAEVAEGKNITRGGEDIRGINHLNGGNLLNPGRYRKYSSASDHKTIHHAVSWSMLYGNRCGPRKHCKPGTNLVCRTKVTDGFMAASFCACDSEPADRVEWSPYLKNCSAPANYTCEDNAICASNNCTNGVCLPKPKRPGNNSSAVCNISVSFIVKFLTAAFLIFSVSHTLT